MTVISVFSGICCNEASVLKQLLDANGMRLLGDGDLVAAAAGLSGMSGDRIEKAFYGKTSVFNKFTHEKERAVAWLRLALARRLVDEDNLLISGFCALLPPREISHVLRVCLIADIKTRLAAAMQERGLAERDAARLLNRSDEEHATWVQELTRTDDPWAEALYDIFLPMHKTTVDNAVALILQHAGAEAVASTTRSRDAARDFLLAATVESALAEKGHTVSVAARAGVVTLTINRKVLLLERLENELKAQASKVEGVREVVTRVGKDYYQSDIYRKVDFAMPSKVLLVDDEREFVQTLSERLSMREVGAHAVFDGESALNMIREDEPEVMVLDLKMPGIDGIEVLRQVKSTRPDVEVIILTGHGTEKDRDVCMGLGAFAYLHKPVDIEVLSRTLQEANAKVQSKKSS